MDKENTGIGDGFISQGRRTFYGGRRMVDTQKKELLPCPFCGCEATLVVNCFEDDHRYPREFWNAKVECDGCDATQGYSIVSSQEAKQEEINEKAVAEVIESWNQRAIIY